MYGYVRIIFTMKIVAGIAGAGMYVMKLRADNAILKANQIALEQSVTKQQELLEKQKADFKAITESNQQLNKLINTLKKDMDALDKRFNKGKRDVGKIGVEKPKVLERILNKGATMP